MNRLAIFSDVHGNAPALEAVLTDIDRQANIDQIVFAGDACLLGPQPEKCIDILQGRDIFCLVGNTDRWILDPPPLDDSLGKDLNERRTSINDWASWTLERIGPRGQSWLEDLMSSFEMRIAPSLDDRDQLLIVHANPHDLLQIIFPSEVDQLKLYGKVRQSEKDLEPLMDGLQASMLAFGHIHIPFRRHWRDTVLINISSVSLPGDGDPRAKYAILTWNDMDGWTVEFRKVAYAVGEEITAYERNRPPGWETAVSLLQAKGCVPQIV